MIQATLVLLCSLTPARRRALCLVLSVTGCTEPQFSPHRDAGHTSDGVEADGEVPVRDAGEDAYVADAAPHAGDAGQGLALELQPFVGRYAVHSYYFVIDGPLRPLGELINLAEIRPAGSGLELVERLCYFRSSWSLGGLLEARSELVYPEDLPARVYEVSVDNGRLSTNLPAFALGYTAVPPDDCKAGGQIPSDPAHDWQAASCSCPTNLAELPAPYALDDCRISDPDHDGQPGITLQVEYGSPPTQAEFYFVQEGRERYLDGRLTPDRRILASLEVNSKTSLLGCEPASPCEVGAAVACAPEFNRSEFVRLDPAGEPSTGDWSCSRLLEAELFVAPPPAFPSGCE